MAACRTALLSALVCALAPAALLAQAPLPPPPPAAEPEPVFGTGLQHNLAVNVLLGQPTVLRLQAALLHQPERTWLAEAYVGSELFDFMAGGGGRVQWSSEINNRGDFLLLAPGLGVHWMPKRGDSWFISAASVRYYLAADVDVSWLHEFSPHFGYELGVKLGLGARLSGWSDDDPSGVMFGHDLFPIISVFGGFRF